DGWAQDLYPQLAAGPDQLATCFHVVGFHDPTLRVGLRHNGAANVLLADGHGATERQVALHITWGPSSGLPGGPGVDYPGWYPEGHPNQKLRCSIVPTGITV